MPHLRAERNGLATRTPHLSNRALCGSLRSRLLRGYLSRLAAQIARTELAPKLRFKICRRVRRFNLGA
jgi:hypothetical protein